MIWMAAPLISDDGLLIELFWIYRYELWGKMNPIFWATSEWNGDGDT